ncbi:hypothetical protein [Streptomyces capoamus]|uniref:hypothetical protein n=1 Tax=Streptomyces capoamus TaxID=68183 RepID=UPI0033975243
MLARASLTIDIVPYASPMPLVGCGVATLPVWLDIPVPAATLVAFFIACRVRVRLTRRPSRA